MGTGAVRSIQRRLAPLWKLVTSARPRHPCGPQFRAWLRRRDGLDHRRPRTAWAPEQSYKLRDWYWKPDQGAGAAPVQLLCKRRLQGFPHRECRLDSVARRYRGRRKTPSPPAAGCSTWRKTTFTVKINTSRNYTPGETNR